MTDIGTLIALAGPTRPGEPNPLASLLMMGLIFAIFYFILILPMRRKQKKLDQLVKGLQIGRPRRPQLGHLRHHRRRRGGRVPPADRRQDQDQGPQERRGRPPGDRDREDGEVMPSALQNPVTLWLLLTAALAGLVYAFMRPELRTKAILYGSFLLACARRDLAAVRAPTTGGPARSTSASTCAAASTSCSRWSSTTRSTPPWTTRSTPRATRPPARASRSRRCSAPRRRPSPSRGSSRRGSRTCATSCATSSATAGRSSDAGEGKLARRR